MTSTTNSSNNKHLDHTLNLSQLSPTALSSTATSEYDFHTPADILTPTSTNANMSAEGFDPSAQTQEQLGKLEQEKPVETKDPKNEEDEKKKAEAEQAEKTAGQIADAVDSSLERLRPLLKMITENVEKANKTPKDDLDEKKLVETLQPLIEQATNILNETLGTIKGIDPKGATTNKAQRNAQDHSATPSEQRLAKGLAELTGSVTKTVETAKEKIKDMPHAKSKLGPLLDMLQDPLFQILSAVGLLLNGVLTLVGNLLDGLGLGGILRGVLKGLGLEKILKSLGIDNVLGKKGKD